MKIPKTILELFRFASQKVPAYRDFLHKYRGGVRSIRSMEEFRGLPIMDKKNYMYRYPLQDIFPNRNVPPMAYASSGSSGRLTFWFRGDQQEQEGGKIHETIFRTIFKIKKEESTLAIICFAMGVWVAGNYTLSACRYAARRGYRITTITPGIEQEDILHILQYLAPSFTNVLLVGYPPFLMNIVAEAVRRKIELNNNMKILTAGDKFSENWRTDILTLVGTKNVTHSLISIYGSADAGIVGYETPLSIFLRRKAFTNKGLARELFGQYLDMPGLVQYDPNKIFFEEVDGELVFTTNAAAPLLRYNIRDRGKIISYQQMRKMMREYGLEKAAIDHGLNEWKFPFLVLKGRSDVAVTFYALNIFPEHIRAGIEDREVAKFLSGNFFAYNETIHRSKVQKLYIKLELNQGVKPTHNIITSISTSIIKNLLKWNTEFRKLYSTLGSRALPEIMFIRYGDRNLESKNKRGLLSIKGKKPKMIL